MGYSHSHDLIIGLVWWLLPTSDCRVGKGHLYVHIKTIILCTPQVLVTQIQFEDGHMIPAWKWGKAEKHEKLELTPEEEQLQEKIRTIWSGILSGQTIDEHTDFFKSGAGSMDVTRLLEEVREVAGVEMENDDVYMNSTFSEFVKQLVLTSRGGQDTELKYDAVSLCYNNIITIY